MTKSIWISRETNKWHEKSLFSNSPYVSYGSEKLSWSFCYLLTSECFDTNNMKNGGHNRRNQTPPRRVAVATLNSCKSARMSTATGRDWLIYEFWVKMMGVVHFTTVVTAVFREYAWQSWREAPAKPFQLESTANFGWVLFLPSLWVQRDQNYSDRRSDGKVMTIGKFGLTGTSAKKCGFIRWSWQLQDTNSGSVQRELFDELREGEERECGWGGFWLGDRCRTAYVAFNDESYWSIYMGKIVIL